VQPIYVETGSSTIFRFDNILDIDSCQQLYQHVLSLHQSFEINKQKVPWAEGDTFSWFDITDKKLKKTIYKSKCVATRLISECFKRTLYPQFTDIVLWRTGRRMIRHLDNGFQTHETFKHRIISSVIYINDDYTGGETFIATEHGYDYISKPRAGSMICFLSNEQNKHGVNEITSGNRVTLPVWYCEEFEQSETFKHANIIEEIIKE